MSGTLVTSLTCPTCGAEVKGTTDSRQWMYHGHRAIKRRRPCNKCGERMTTIELPQPALEKLAYAQLLALAGDSRMRDLLSTMMLERAVGK